MEYETRSATYYVDHLKLSKLFADLCEDLSKEVIPYLKLKILRYALRNVFFIDENKATNLINQLSTWKNEEDALDTLKFILESLYKLMIFDYTLYGSFIIRKEGKISWDIDVSILLPN